MAESMALAEKLRHALVEPDVLQVFKVLISPVFARDPQAEDEGDYTALARFVELDSYNEKHTDVLHGLLASGCDPSYSCSRLITPRDEADRLPSNLQQLMLSGIQDFSANEHVMRWLSMSAEQLDAEIGSTPLPAVLSQPVTAKSPQRAGGSQRGATNRRDDAVRALYTAEPSSRSSLRHLDRDRSPHRSSPPVSKPAGRGSRMTPPVPGRPSLPRYTGRLPPPGWNQEASRLRILPTPCAAKYLSVGGCRRPECPFEHGRLHPEFRHESLGNASTSSPLRQTSSSPPPERQHHRRESPPASEKARKRAYSSSDYGDNRSAKRRPNAEDREKIEKSSGMTHALSVSRNGPDQLKEPLFDEYKLTFCKKRQTGCQLRDQCHSAHTERERSWYLNEEWKSQGATVALSKSSGRHGGSSLVGHVAASADVRPEADFTVPDLENLRLSPADKALLINALRHPAAWQPGVTPPTLRATVAFRQTPVEDAIVLLRDATPVYADDAATEARYRAYLRMCAYGELNYCEGILNQIAAYNDNIVKLNERANGTFSAKHDASFEEAGKSYNALAEPAVMGGTRGTPREEPIRSANVIFNAHPVAVELAMRDVQHPLR